MTSTMAEGAPATPSKGIAKAVFGLSCAMIGALALCYAGDYLFLTFPDLREIWNSVNVRLPWSSHFVSTYGVWLWLMLAAGTVWSVTLALRQPGRRGTLALNVTMMICTLALAYIVNQGAWNPIINMLLDLTDPAREIPRRF